MQAGKRSPRRNLVTEGLLDPGFVGKRYGCLTIATRTVRNHGPQLEVEVTCDCGHRSFRKFHKLSRRTPRGCENCMRRFGGHCPEWIYRRVQHQWRRCTDPKEITYHRYGGRGIQFKFGSVYEATCWIVQHLGVPTDTSLTLDRIDNNGHYEPGNLRWATVSQQMKNREKITKPGSRCRKFWADYPEVGYSIGHLDSLFRAGLSPAQIAERWKIYQTRRSK